MPDPKQSAHPLSNTPTTQAHRLGLTSHENPQHSRLGGRSNDSADQSRGLSWLANKAIERYLSQSESYLRAKLLASDEVLVNLVAFTDGYIEGVASIIDRNARTKLLRFWRSNLGLPIQQFQFLPDAIRGLLDGFVEGAESLGTSAGMIWTGDIFDQLEALISKLRDSTNKDVFYAMGKQAGTSSSTKVVSTTAAGMAAVSYEANKILGAYLVELLIDFVTTKIPIRFVISRFAKALGERKPAPSPPDLDATSQGDSGLLRRSERMPDTDMPPGDRKPIDDGSLQPQSGSREPTESRSRRSGRRGGPFHFEIFQQRFNEWLQHPTTRKLLKHGGSHHQADWNKKAIKLAKSRARAIDLMRKLEAKYGLGPLPMNSPLVVRFARNLELARDLGKTMYSSLRLRIWARFFDDVDIGANILMSAIALHKDSFLEVLMKQFKLGEFRSRKEALVALRKFFDKKDNIKKLWGQSANLSSTNAILTVYGVRVVRGTPPKNRLGERMPKESAALSLHVWTNSGWRPVQLDHFLRQKEYPYGAADRMNLGVTVPSENLNDLEALRNISAQVFSGSKFEHGPVPGISKSLSETDELIAFTQRHYSVLKEHIGLE